MGLIGASLHRIGHSKGDQFGEIADVAKDVPGALMAVRGALRCQRNNNVHTSDKDATTYIHTRVGTTAFFSM